MDTENRHKQLTNLSKVWYIDNNLRYPAIVIKKVEDKPFYSIMVYFGGIWESVLASPDSLIERVENWSEKMFEFRKQTMNIENIQWEFNKGDNK